MPTCRTTISWLLLCASLAWISSIVNGDTARYGMRIKPLQKIVPTRQNPTYCSTCHNKTVTQRTKSNTISQNVPNSKIAIKRVDEESSKPKDKFKYSVNPLVKIQQTASPIYSAFPTHNTSRGATFFFTQLEPHRFEYRAMFQHHGNHFEPFVQNFEPFSREYPPLPKFPSFPDFPDFFQNNDHPFPKLRDFTFPTLSPEIKRVWDQVPEVQHPPKPILPELPEQFENPLTKNYDIVLGHANYPKIFRFNDERMNIEDFDRQKKIRYYNLAKNGPNSLAEIENVKRDHLLILHGGIFTVKEPPQFSKHIKKRRKSSTFGHHNSNF